MYINARDLDKVPELHEVNSLDSVEDVATILNTFVRVTKEYDYIRISDVLQDDNGSYYFVIDGDGTFNLYDFINKKFRDDDIKVSCINALYLFPERLSRGIAKPMDFSMKMDDYDEDDIPTGYLDSNPIGGDTVYCILRKSDGSRVTIPSGGIIMGRSASKATYVIKGNTNIGRVHCNIYSDNGVLKVHDFNSLNGTFINGRRVQGADAIINVGDRLTLADEDFEITM